MVVVAIIQDGRWTSIDGQHHEVDIPRGQVDQIVAHLAQVVMLAQNLSNEDQRRTRDFVRAALATLEATTALPTHDQKMFEAHLRGRHE